MGITVVAPFEVEDDHQSFVQNFTGGIKAWQRDTNEWSFGPIIYQGEPVMAGILSQELLRTAVQAMELTAVLMEHHVCIKGESSTARRSISLLGRTDRLATTDIWQTISGNLNKARMAKFKKDFPDNTNEQWVSESNNLTQEESYSAYISDSLKSMDICINAICDYYHEQLVSSLRSGRKENQRYSSLADLSFTANVHSFFLHLGSARDYLASLIAARCGMPDNIDAMNRLTDKLKWESLPDDPLIKLMVDQKILTKKGGAEKSKISGWFEKVSDVRNQFIHKRPFGLHEDERMGWVKSAGGIAGHYRFCTPINLNENSDFVDALDYISDVYHKINRLFGDLALVSGYNVTIPSYSDKDFKGFRVTTGNHPKTSTSQSNNGL